MAPSLGQLMSHTIIQNDLKELDLVCKTTLSKILMAF